MSLMLLTLESFQSLTEAMASAAEAQEWEDISRIGAERTALSVTLPFNLAAKLPPSELALGRMILKRCQHLDAQTQSIVEERQKALRVLLREPNFEN